MLVQLMDDVEERENSTDVARQFTISSPTFSFDGMEESLQLKYTGMNKSIPPQFLIDVNFSCTHSGYGDRTGKILLQVITPHIMKITVIESKVTSAVIDEKWDEIKQQSL